MATILDRDGDIQGFGNLDDVSHIASTFGLDNTGGARETIDEIGSRNIAFVIILPGFVCGNLLGFETFNGSLYLALGVWDFLRNEWHIELR